MSGYEKEVMKDAAATLGVGVAVIALGFLLVLVLVLAVRTRWRHGKEEGFYAAPTRDDTHLRLLHVKPEEVTLWIDAWRGPPSTDLPVLSKLVARNGLRLQVFDGGGEQGTQGRGRMGRRLYIGDAAMVAASASASASASAHGGGDTLLVAPLMPVTHMRMLWLLAAMDPIRGPPPTLGHLVRSGASVHVRCRSKLEEELFGLAWALAGGGDVSASPQVIVAPYQTRSSDEILEIVPVWGCPGSRAIASEISAWPPTHAACISYHPKDDEAADGFARDSAPHILHARAPALSTATTDALMPLMRASGLASTLELVATPSLVLVRLGTPPERKREDSAMMEESDDDAVGAMADAVSDAIVLSGTGGNNSLTAASMCRHFEAQGIRLLPRTAATIRTLEVKRFSSSSSSSRRVPVLEQFAELPPLDGRTNEVVGRDFGHLRKHIGWSRDPEDGPMDGPPVELVPTHSVSISTTRVGKRDEIVLGGGYVEAELMPKGTTAVDGVRLRPGDRLILTRQEDNAREQEGTYVVVGSRGSRGIPVLQRPVAVDPPPGGGYVTSLERALVDPSKPLLNSQAAWQWRFALPVAADSGGASYLREGDEVAWLPMPGAPTGRVDAVGHANAVTRNPKVARVVEIVVPAMGGSGAMMGASSATPGSAAFEAEWFHPMSACIINDGEVLEHTLDTRQHCNTSSRHQQQQQQQQQHPHRQRPTWDRPCSQDAECPFLITSPAIGLADGEHPPMTRGRCLPSGRCEMPVGVRPAGYRGTSDAADASDAPLPLCRCPRPDTGGPSLTSASHACCSFPGATPIFQLERA